MERNRPIVTHAGCGGRVRNEDGRPLCFKCGRRITDPQELNARGTGFRQEPEAGRVERYRLDA